MSQTIILTEEEIKINQYHIPLLLAAMEAGDEEAINFHRSKMICDPDALMNAKILSGAQWIRERNYNTILADRKFGHGWLDK